MTKQYFSKLRSPRYTHLLEIFSTTLLVLGFHHENDCEDNGDRHIPLINGSMPERRIYMSSRLRG